MYQVKKETESGEEQLNAVDTEAPPAADRRVAKDPGEETGRYIFLILHFLSDLLTLIYTSEEKRARTIQG